MSKIGPFFQLFFEMQANRKLLDELMGADRDGAPIVREVTVGSA